MPLRVVRRTAQTATSGDEQRGDVAGAHQRPQGVRARPASHDERVAVGLDLPFRERRRGVTAAALDDQHAEVTREEILQGAYYGVSVDDVRRVRVVPAGVCGVGDAGGVVGH